MGFTYRQGKEGRLSIEEMDNNILYTEEQISSLTASISTLNTNLATATASIVALEEQLAGLTSSNGPVGPTGPQGATGPAGFGTTGAISFPFLPGNQRTGSGDNLQFEKGSVYQKIISTADGTESAPTVERLVISGGDSYQNGPTYSGEGGDIYLWAGKGQDGGDIKVDAGEGISSGGTVKIRGGYTDTGDGGFVEIFSGASNNGDGGNVEITAGEGYGNVGGSVLITSGYGTNTGGDILLSSSNGGTAGGNVIVETAGGVERMRITNDGNINIGTTTPALALNVTLAGDLNIDTTRSGITSTSKITTIGDWQNQDKGNKITVDDSTASGIAYYTNLAANGKFGINTENPSVALDVVGDMNITGVITSTSSMILKPDSSLETDQYIILDPTEGGPNHIHIRAGGPIDDSTVDLFIGGEDNNLKVSDTTKTVQINSKNLYTQDSASSSVGPNYDSATWSGNLITITNPDSTLVNFINGYQVATDIFTVFYDPTTAVSLNITNKDQSNPTVLTVDQTAPTASLAITGIDIEIIRYQSGRVTADNGTVTIQTGDTDGPENWVFGTTGSITFPDNTVQTTAYIPPKYKVYTALLTQSGGDGSTEKYPGDEIYSGITYYIFTNDDNFDLVQYGAPNSNVGTYFVCNQNATLPEDINIQLNYNTGAPVATVLENTIGNIWFTYNNVGSYYAMSDALFIGDKTTCITSQSAYNDTGATFIYRDGENEIVLETLGFFSELAADDILARTMLEIRVYN